MPSAAEVQPQKWSAIRVLYDDDEYSVIAGFYEVPTRRVLGERWNGHNDSPIGFPNVAGYPIWHVVPSFMERSVLHAILDELATHPHASSPEHVQAVLDELQRINQTQAAQT